MMQLTYTIVGDGTSESALIPMLDWLIRQSGYNGELQGHCCDFRLFRRTQGNNFLAQRIKYGLQLYPCDLLFVHRDAERASRQKRVQEITVALNILFTSSSLTPSVCVIPIRMTETWLLFDEAAIRRAAGNPNGSVSLVLPDLVKLEKLARPKGTLYELIKQATGLSSHRRESFPVNRSAKQISQYIRDFSPLRSLSAFATLERDTRNIIYNRGWDTR